jgi:ribonuclease HII
VLPACASGSDLETSPTGRLRCDGRFERELRERGFQAIAGVDEAGRGSLFGPVFAAAVILPPAHGIRGLNDSKQLTAGKREELAGSIRSQAVAWAVAQAEADEIDRINIYQASRLAMRRAVTQLAPSPDFLLVDALRIDLEVEQLGLIKGDARVHSIAAASILAKVCRDACMLEWDSVYPQYGLARHKGYGTAEHLAALEKFGPTPQHRVTFAPVRHLGLPIRAEACQ